ncbi:olfactory receptor 10A3-like [Gastrophryne carolinensis]
MATGLAVFFNRTDGRLNGFFFSSQNELDDFFIRRREEAACGQNRTMVVELVLLGFGNLLHLKDVVFMVFLLVYLTALLGNLLIVYLIITCPRLHSPMYFFLCNLSACEILFTTIIMPNMLYIIWRNGGSMSMSGCVAQMYLGASSGSAECLLLTAMAYDRYVAICEPLRYSSIMNIRTYSQLALWCWLSAFLVLAISTFSISRLRFCDANTIDHLFCDFTPLLRLSTSEEWDLNLLKIEALIITMVLALVPFLLIVLSYSSIFCTILKMSSKVGRQRTFSTCSSHLASVCTYFGTILVIYLVPPQRYSERLNKILSLLYTLATPLLNPVIYSFRNREMQRCIGSYFTLVWET